MKIFCKLEKEEKAPNGLRVCKEENSGLAQINFKQLESFVKMALHIFSITFHHVKCIKVNFVFHKRKKVASSVDPIRIAQFLM
ncbi:hypothetical protein T12_9787 [Trichinella patagoniensis]|uniref:Uncharacterized protein n=1 Tax=Trichinella patagoniensis TaxID=990121 RepID=A0A0V0ZHP6_9BILA|nr:hypothetical protein T12_9787 [Trichinella patagoniensis]